MHGRNRRDHTRDCRADGVEPNWQDSTSVPPATPYSSKLKSKIVMKTITKAITALSMSMSFKHNKHFKQPKFFIIEY
jgi:hypothetical protein